MEENQNPALPVLQETNQQPPIPSSPPSEVVKKTSKFSLKAIISTIIFLLLAGGAAAGYVYREPIIKFVSKPTPTPSVSIPTPTPNTLDTSSWITHTDDANHFTLKYPDDWFVLSAGVTKPSNQSFEEFVNENEEALEKG